MPRSAEHLISEHRITIRYQIGPTTRCCYCSDGGAEAIFAAGAQRGCICLSIEGGSFWRCKHYLKACACTKNGWEGIFAEGIKEPVDGRDLGVKINAR